MQKRDRKRKGSIKKEVDMLGNREKEDERKRERERERERGGRTYYVKGYIVGNGSEVMLIQSEVATELAGFHREEGLRCGAKRQEGKEGRGDIEEDLSAGRRRYSIYRGRDR